MGVLLRRSGAVGAVALALAAGASSGADEREDLGRGVPPDAGIYFHQRVEAGSRFAEVWSRVLEAVRDAGFFQDLAGIALDAVDIEAAAIEWSGLPVPANFATRTRRVVRREAWLEILSRVDWLSAVASEVAAGARWEGDRADLLVLARLPSGRGGETGEALRRLAYAVASLSPALEIVESWGEREKALVLGPSSGPPGASFAIRGDVLVVSTSPSLLRRSLQLLSGEASELGYAEAPERSEALSSLPLEPGGGSEGEFELHVRPSRIRIPGVDLGAFGALVAAGRASGSELRYAFRLAGGAGVAGSTLPLGDEVRTPGGAVPADADSFEASAGWDPDALGGLGGALERKAVECLEAASASGLLGEASTRKCLDVLELASGLAAATRGRRTYVASPRGAALVLELAEVRPDGKRAEEVLSRVEGALGGRPLATGTGVPAPPPDLRWLEIAGAGLRLGTARLLVGATSGRLVLATSSSALDEALGLRGVRFSRRELSELTGIRALPERAEPVSVRATERPRFLEAARLVLALARREPERGVGEKGRDALDALPRLDALVRDLDFLGRERSCVVRDGASLLGVGRWSFRAPRPAGQRDF